MSRGTLDPAAAYCFHVRGFHPLRPAFPGRSANRSAHMMQSVTPVCTHTGLGSSSFARRYFRNRCFFLFLRLLRCFSSPGSLPYVMDWRMDDRGILCQVSPFRNLRINGYVLLPEAYRSLSRLSSALSAKASALRPSSLDLFLARIFAIRLLPACPSVGGSPLFLRLSSHCHLQSLSAFRLAFGRIFVHRFETLNSY